MYIKKDGMMNGELVLSVKIFDQSFFKNLQFSLVVLYNTVCYKTILREIVNDGILFLLMVLSNKFYSSFGLWILLLESITFFL